MKSHAKHTPKPGQKDAKRPKTGTNSTGTPAANGKR